MQNHRNILAVASWLMFGFSTVTTEASVPASPGNAPSPHFWDPIPVSASTTPPSEILDGYWHGQFQRVNKEVSQARNAEIVFFGDSITWYWSLGGGKGQDLWREFYARNNPINMGNSGDITPVMLYRGTHGNLNFPEGCEPKVAVLLCGTNNFVVTQSAGGRVKWDLGVACPPEEVAHGARAIAQVFRRRLPRTRVIMMGILPVSNRTKWAKCRQTNAVNAAFTYNEDEVVYLDLQDTFLQSDETINADLFSDGTHLTPAGYRVWAESLDPVVSRMMEAAPLNPAKIMLIGGSMTEGADSPTSYRRYLDGMLRRQGHLIDFVGSQDKHHNNQIEPDTYEFDVDHEGHWGRDSTWVAQNITGMLLKAVPNVAVIHLGTEDILSGAEHAEALTEKIIENMDRVIKALRSQNNAVKIVLAGIMPILGKSVEVGLLNRKVSNLARARTNRVSSVVVADLQAGFSPSDDLVDNAPLPNAAGARKMAEVFARVIDDVLGDHSSMMR